MSAATTAERVLERFWDKIDWDRRDGDCWWWDGTTHKDGTRVGRRGVYRLPRQGLPKRVAVHAPRMAHQIVNGPVLKGLQVNHKCDNPLCVNPDHLYAGTHRDNMVDRYRIPEEIAEKIRAEYNAIPVTQPGLHGCDGESRGIYKKRGEVSRLAKKYGISRSFLHVIIRGVRNLRDLKR